MKTSKVLGLVMAVALVATAKLLAGDAPATAAGGEQRPGRRYAVAARQFRFDGADHNRAGTCASTGHSAKTG